MSPRCGVGMLCSMIAVLGMTFVGMAAENMDSPGVLKPTRRKVQGKPKNLNLAVAGVCVEFKTPIGKTQADEIYHGIANYVGPVYHADEIAANALRRFIQDQCTHLGYRNYSLNLSIDVVGDGTMVLDVAFVPPVGPVKDGEGETHISQKSHRAEPMFVL